MLTKGFCGATEYPVPLAPKALETLLALIECRDRVVTKDELLQRIWGDTVVEEGGLTRNISILRKALGEKPDDHHYVVTVPGRGIGSSRMFANAREAQSRRTRLIKKRFSSSPASRYAVRSFRTGHPFSRTSGRASVSRGARGCRCRESVAGTPVAPVGGWRRWPVGGLVYALRPTQAASAERPSIAAIAVLPLDNLSGDPSQEYFVDGMTEALIGNLARIRALRVVSRTSVMRFKGAAPPLNEIARTLNVDAVLEGSVQRSGDRVRVSVQLIHVSTDAHLWAREYQRELTDVLKLQSDVAGAVAEEVRARVTAEERARLASAGSVNPAAYQEFLLGRHYLWRLTEEDLARAIGHFEQSVRLDPRYAAAYAGLSHAWWWRGIWGATTFEQVRSPSRAAAFKALELDPGLPEAHVSMGRIRFGHEWGRSGARQEFTRASLSIPITLTPTSFRRCCAWPSGVFPRPSTTWSESRERDPLSVTVQSFFGRVFVSRA